MDFILKQGDSEWMIFHICLSLASNEARKGLYYHTVKELVEGMRVLQIPYHINAGKVYTTFEPYRMRDLLGEYNSVVIEFLRYHINPVWYQTARSEDLIAIEVYIGQSLREIMYKYKSVRAF
jgi:allophanate hydrolase subunit 1